MMLVSCAGGERTELLPATKAGLMRSCGRAAFRSGSSNSFRPFPGAVVWQAQISEIHLGRWCLATVTSVAGSTPARSASSGSSVGRAKSNIPSPLVPRPELFSGAARTGRAKTSTLAGGVGRGYFLSRSARVRIPPGAQTPVAQWQSVGKHRNRLFPGHTFSHT
jgi:hypothetical protein